MRRADIERLLAILRLRDSDAARLSETFSESDTPALMTLLRYEGAELWFHRRVQQLRIAIPDMLKTELRLAAQRVSLVNMRIDAQTLAVTALLSNASIPWALVKGQARRAAVVRYPNADARAVSDVDLLVPADQAQSAWQELTSNGFRRAREGPAISPTHHLPALIDANNVAVELHTTMSLSVPPAEAWRRATAGADAVEWSDTQTSVPSATELLWQAVAHGSADGTDGYRLKSLLNVAAILESDTEIDWTRIEERLGAREVFDNDTGQAVPEERVRRFLDVAAWFAAMTLPSHVIPQRRGQIARLLQWRAMILSSCRNRALCERLLEEGTRVETLSPVAPFIASAWVWPNARRRVASLAARAAYHGWRAGNALR